MLAFWSLLFFSTALVQQPFWSHLPSGSYTNPTSSSPPIPNSALGSLIDSMITINTYFLGTVFYWFCFLLVCVSKSNYHKTFNVCPVLIHSSKTQCHIVLKTSFKHLSWVESLLKHTFTALCIMNGISCLAASSCWGPAPLIGNINDPLLVVVSPFWFTV